MDFLEFLVSAKQHTYSASGNRAGERLADGGTQCTYAEGEFAYRNTHYGSDPFAGQELVFRNGVPIWAMNYRGQTFIPPWLRLRADDIYAFLRRVLARVEKDRPCRGPPSFTEGRFHYVDLIVECPRFFGRYAGQEQILFLSRRGELKVYELYYHGGPLDTFRLSM